MKTIGPVLDSLHLRARKQATRGRRGQVSLLLRFANGTDAFVHADQMLVDEHIPVRGVLQSVTVALACRVGSQQAKRVEAAFEHVRLAGYFTVGKAHAHAHDQAPASDGQKSCASGSGSRSTSAPALDDSSRFVVKAFSLGEAWAPEQEVSFVTHCSLDRVDVMLSALRHWATGANRGAFASVAIWGVDELVAKQLLASKLGPLTEKLRVNVRVVRRRGFPGELPAETQLEVPYPINVLRNQALAAATTPLALLADADLMPGGSILRDVARARLAAKANGEAADALALVVPAFEDDDGRTCRRAARVADKAGLLALLARGAVQPYKAAHQPHAHGPTDVARWIRELEARPNSPGTAVPEAAVPEAAVPDSPGPGVSAPDSQGPSGVASGLATATRVDCAAHPQFEPYVVVAVQGLPRFDERFAGYGWNKVAFVQDLCKRGYVFEVLPNAWLVHCRHDKSPWSVAFSTSLEARMLNRATRFEWLHST